jgi:hypothetical protein
MLIGQSPTPKSPLQGGAVHDLNKMHITEDKIIVCHNCQCELFITPVRLAKSKINLTQEAVGLVHETPRALCMKCYTEIPHASKDIKTKKDFEELPSTSLGEINVNIE